MAPKVHKLTLILAGIGLLSGCDIVIGYDDIQATGAADGGAAATGGGGGMAGATTADGGGGTLAQGGAGTEGGGGSGGDGGAATCDDAELNGDESDVDCGGSCAPCVNGAACMAGADCVSGACDTTCGPWLATHQQSAGTDMQVRDVAIDTAGNVIAVGRFSGSVNIGGTTYNSNSGSEDAFIIKHHSDGTVDWVKVVGGSGEFDVLNSVAVDASDNIIVAGHCRVDCDFGKGVIGTAGDDMVVAKLDADGNEEWAVASTDPSAEIAHAVAVDSAGDVYVGGHFFGAIALFSSYSGAQSADVFVAKLSGINGAHMASTAIQGAGLEQAYGIDVGGGRVVVVGRTNSVVDYGSGTAVGTGTSEYGAFVLGLDDGDLGYVWERVMFPTNSLVDDAVGLGVVVDQNADTYVSLLSNRDEIDVGNGPIPSAGYTNRRTIVAKYDSVGAYGWAQVIGGLSLSGANAEATNIALDRVSGNIVVLGTFSGDEAELGAYVVPQATDASRTHFVGVISTSGIPQALRAYGGTAYLDYKLKGLDVHATNGNVVVGGAFLAGGAIDFGTGPVMAMGDPDGFTSSLGNVP